MKVSEKMYGLPGKCIACRQKIRIPRRDELPPDTTELYLRDHPEFLRKVARKPLEGDEAPPLEEESLDAFHGTDQDRVVTVPLDPLEPLQILCSLDHALTRRLVENPEENGTVERQKSRVREARAVVDDQLRQRLMEVAIEMANVNEKIAQTGLAARLGEMDAAAYHETVGRYRVTRDRLERRQQNLRAWLTVHDPYKAGGLVKTHIDDIPEPGAQLPVPVEVDATQPLLHQHIEYLREALFERAHTERKVREANQMRDEHTLPDDELRELRAECKAERQRAEARVAFARDRLTQAIQDFRSDLQVVQAQADLARGRVQVGEISRGRFDQEERQFRQHRNDLQQAMALAQRAVNANVATDVPYPKGTFLARLGVSSRDQGLGADSYLLWTAAAVLVVSVFLPAWNEHSLLSEFWDDALLGTIWQWGVLVPLAAAGALIIGSAIEFRRLRGAVILLSWFVVTLMVTYLLYEQQFTFSPVGDKLRAMDSSWWLRPAFIAFGVASLITWIACVVAMAPYAERWAPWVTAALAGLIATMIVTDVAGMHRPLPFVHVDLAATNAKGFQTTTAAIGNRGGRAAYLTFAAPRMPNAYLFAIEERLGPTSWREIPLPVTRLASIPPNHSVFDVVAPGTTEELSIMLPPGEYRAKLRNSDGEDIDVEPFRIENSGRAAQPNVDDNPLDTPSEHRPVVVPSRVEAELKLFIAGPNREPRFSISLYSPSGEETKRDLSLGDEVHEGWYLTEYNPQSQTVTLSDGTRLIILERGHRELLPIAQPPKDANS